MTAAAVLVTPPQYGQWTVERAAPWNPWRALRERDHIDFGLDRLPACLGGAVYWPEDGRVIIAIDRSLTRQERSAALAHELVHDERGGGKSFDSAPDTWDAVVARDELMVHREVARRLVPVDDLREYCERLATTYQPVRAADVAEEFDVSADVALTALRLMLEEGT